MSQLLDVAVDTKLKLCALWASATLCSIYSMLVQFYVPGWVERMNALAAFLSHTTWMWIAIPILIPILMIILSVALPAKYNRILNITVGAFFVLLWGIGRMLNLDVASLRESAGAATSAARDAAAALEVALVVLAALVVWYAWNWPRKPNAV